MLFIPDKLVWLNKLTNEFIGIWCGSYVFTSEMCRFCDSVMTIKEVNEEYYIMEEDIYNNQFTDEMIDNIVMPVVTAKFKIDDRVETNDGLFGFITEVKYNEKVNCYEYYVSFIVDGGYYYENQLKLHKKESDSIVPKFKVGDMICKVGGLSNGYLVTSVSDEYYGLSLPDSNGVGVLPVAEQDEWVLLSAGDKKIEGIVEEANKLDTDAFSDGYDQGYDDGQHDMNEWKLPDGFEFRDENGNVIEAKKIVLEKLVAPKFKKGDKIKDKNNRVWYVVQVGSKHFDISSVPNAQGYFVPMEDQDDYELVLDRELPKTYEECLSTLKIKGYDIVTYVPSWTEYEKALYQKVLKLRELIICRDAYWKIAGEEMGLGKPWEPDFTNFEEDRYGLYTCANKIVLDSYGGGDVNVILTFPTEEMRDAFYENFKELIEECKEFL